MALVASNHQCWHVDLRHVISAQLVGRSGELRKHHLAVVAVAVPVASSSVDHNPGQTSGKNASTAARGPPRSAAGRTAAAISAMNAFPAGTRPKIGGSENTAPATGPAH